MFFDLSISAFRKFGEFSVSRKCSIHDVSASLRPVNVRQIGQCSSNIFLRNVFSKGQDACTPLPLVTGCLPDLQKKWYKEDESSSSRSKYLSSAIFLVTLDPPCSKSLDADKLTGKYDWNVIEEDQTTHKMPRQLKYPVLPTQSEVYCKAIWLLLNHQCS